METVVILPSEDEDVDVDVDVDGSEEGAHGSGGMTKQQEQHKKITDIPRLPLVLLQVAMVAWRWMDNPATTSPR